MRSTWDNSIRRQQYRVTPRPSRTFPASSPAFTLVAKSSHLSPINLPQVKQRTGMMILVASFYILRFRVIKHFEMVGHGLLPIAFLFSGPGTGSSKLLWFFSPGVASDHGSVVVRKDCLKARTLCPF